MMLFPDYVSDVKFFVLAADGIPGLKEYEVESNHHWEKTTIYLKPGIFSIL